MSVRVDDASVAAPVVAGAPHCPACCPLARAEAAAFDRGYHLGRPRDVHKDDDGSTFRAVLLVTVLVLLIVKVWQLAGDHAAERKGETP